MQTAPRSQRSVDQWDPWLAVVSRSDNWAAVVFSEVADASIIFVGSLEK
jgi:hypothetical protein